MLADRWTLTALLGGAATTVLVFFLLGSQPTGSANAAGQATTDTGSIVVATGFIPAGTQLSQDRMAVRVVLADSIPVGAASGLDQLVGKRALVPLYRGEAILNARVGDGVRSANSLVLPGRTVFALLLDPAHAVGGAINGGDMISILGTATSKQGEPLTILMDNIMVLGLAGEFPFGGALVLPGAAATGAASGGALSPTTATRDGQKIALLDLSLEDAQTLARAIENGHVFVALKAGAIEKPIVKPTQTEEGGN